MNDLFNGKKQIAILLEVNAAESCGYCMKQKDSGTVVVQFTGEQSSSSLCWGCLQKQLAWRSRQANGTLMEVVP